jgi:outer membrane protein OmpA-like peptidoglycan-associated protein
MAAQGVRGFDDVRRQRQETNENGVLVVREPGRTIIRENDRVFVRHDENERFRELGGNIRSERRGGEDVTIYDRGGGEQVITVTDENGRLVRRLRRGADGREVVIIDNGGRAPRSFKEEVVTLPPPVLRIPRERYIVSSQEADETLLYDTLVAEPVASLPRRYTLDQVRYSPDVRAQMRSVDISDINFETGVWTLTPDQMRPLTGIAAAIKRALQRNQNEVFLIEGHTDAVGSDVDNLSLSDRRAQSVAAVLTRDFQIPPENLTTQGYGSQYPKVQTAGAARENRRVTLRRITPLLANAAPPPR